MENKDIINKYEVFFSDDTNEMDVYYFLDEVGNYYIHKFIKNGFTSMSFLLLITGPDLILMGVKLAHRRYILHKIESYNKEIQIETEEMKTKIEVTSDKAEHVAIKNMSDKLKDIQKGMINIQNFEKNLNEEVLKCKNSINILLQELNKVSTHKTNELDAKYKLLNTNLEEKNNSNINDNHDIHNNNNDQKVNESINYKASDMAIKRIKKELNNLTSNPIANCSVSPTNNLLDWIAKISGPKGTPYHGGKYVVNIKFRHDYPLTPPKVTFMTRIFHPYIQYQVNIYHVLFSSTSGLFWSPTITIGKILLQILSLLTDPTKGFGCSLNKHASELLQQTDTNMFNRTARACTLKFATIEYAQILPVNINIDQRQLLCIGYIRAEAAKIQLTRNIETEIRNIIYNYRFVEPDSWDLSYVDDKKVSINGNILTAIDGCCTNYGNVIINKNEYYTWKLRLKSRRLASYIHQPNIGIIKSDDKILSQYKNNSTNWHGHNKGYWLSAQCGLIYGEKNTEYGALFFKTGDIMEMTLDLRNKSENTLSYCINGTNYGIAVSNIPVDDGVGYVLAVSFHYGRGTAVELLQ